MKIKITKIIIYNQSEKTILTPDNLIMDIEHLPEYRHSIKENNDEVLFSYEELGENYA